MWVFGVFFFFLFELPLIACVLVLSLPCPALLQVGVSAPCLVHFPGSMPPVSVWAWPQTRDRSREKPLVCPVESPAGACLLIPLPSRTVPLGSSFPGLPQLQRSRNVSVAQTVKNLPASAGDLGLIPGWGRSPEEGHGNPLQHSCLENPMDRAAWRAAAHRAAESDMTEQLSARTHTHTGRQECLFGCRRDAIVAVLLAAAEGRFSCVRRPRNTAVVLHCWHEGGSPVQLIPEAMWPDQLRTKEGLQFS